jgi:hypothetical protein
MITAKRAGVLACAFAAIVVAAGCAGPSTFVSTSAPPESVGEAWFQDDIQPVKTAIARAMFEGGATINVRDTTATKVVGVLPQPPYMPKGQAEATSTKPAVYNITAALSKVGLDTYVKFTVVPKCPGCNGTTAFVWNYPGDLMRDIYERADGMLRVRWHPVSYPYRYYRYRHGYWRPYHRGWYGWGGWGWGWGGFAPGYYDHDFGGGFGGDEGYYQGGEGEGGDEGYFEGGGGEDEGGGGEGEGGDEGGGDTGARGDVSGS